MSDTDNKREVEVDEELKDKALGVIAFGYRLLKYAGYEIYEGIPKEKLQEWLSQYAEYCDEIAEMLSTEQFEVHRHGLKEGIKMALTTIQADTEKRTIDSIKEKICDNCKRELSKQDP